MPAFLIDEDLPRSTTRILKEQGHRVFDVRDCGLRGHGDDEIFEFAQREKAAVLTGDLGFGNILRYPIGSHHGVVIAHFPNEISTTELNRHIAAALQGLSETDLSGNLIIIEPGQLRIRKK
jgi:predicted nuclease of predicted toxin-antitoxin system